MAGAALGDIHGRFAWQAWHLWHWAGSGGLLGPVLVAGDAAALCVTGVALGDIHLRLAWQARHLVTSTVVSRGRRGTYGVTHHLSHTTLSHTIFHTQLCHTLSFTNNFHRHHLSHTTLSHAFFHTQLSRTHHLSHTTLSHTHTPSFFVTHHLSHTTLSHTTLFYFSILHHLLCLSFLPRPCYNISCSLLEEVDLWGYRVLEFFWFVLRELRLRKCLLSRIAWKGAPHFNS